MIWIVFLKVVGSSVLVAAGIIILVPLNVLFGYIAGLILKTFCGTLLMNGLNLLFNTTRFSPNHLPMICATLAAFAGYMRTSTTVKKEN